MLLFIQLELLVAIFEDAAFWISNEIECERSNADSFPPHPQSEGHETSNYVLKSKPVQGSNSVLFWEKQG